MYTLNNKNQFVKEDVIPSIFTKEIEINPDREREFEEQEEARAKKERLNLYKKTAPERYHKESIDTFIATTDSQKKAKELMIQFIKKCKAGAFVSLVLIGGAGTGKTHLGCAAIREIGGEYTTASLLVERYRRAKSFSSKETEADIIKHYESEPLVVIDEIGRSNNTVDEVYSLYQIINARYNTRKATILITNESKTELLNFMGEAINNRLLESAAIFEFDKGQKSYRFTLRQNEI